MCNTCRSARSINIFAASTICFDFHHVSQVLIIGFDSVVYAWVGLALDAAEASGQTRVPVSSSLFMPFPLSPDRSYDCQLGSYIVLSETDVVRHTSVITGNYEFLRRHIDLEIRISARGQESSIAMFAAGRPAKQTCSGGAVDCLLGGAQGHLGQIKALETFVSILLDSICMAVNAEIVK